MISIWEKNSFLKADIGIVGAGITGLSAAASLKEANPKLEVIVLEKGILPSGASTKNAGFACFGSVSELVGDIETIGKNETFRLVQNRIKGLNKTIKRLGKETIDLQMKSGYELLFNHEGGTIAKIEEVNELLYPLFDDPIYRLADKKIASFGLNNTRHLIENKYEGQLDTGKLMRSLWQYCVALGVRIHTGCHIRSIAHEDHEVAIDASPYLFKVAKVGLCTNGFTNELMKKPLDLTPGRGLVLGVVPEKPLKLEGTYHYEDGFYYFRDYYGKLIFGGGRNLDLSTETTTDFGINQEIKKKLLSDLEQIILPNQRFDIEMEWSGIMAFGPNKKPLITQIDDHIVAGVRLGGMGVAIGSLVGEEVAKSLTKKMGLNR